MPTAFALLSIVSVSKYIEGRGDNADRGHCQICTYKKKIKNNFLCILGPLNAFPWVLNGLIESAVSFKRLNGFFSLEEFNPDDYFSRKITYLDHLIIILNLKPP